MKKQRKTKYTKIHENKRHLQALVDRVFDYETSIEQLRTKEKTAYEIAMAWKNYGRYYACSLCATVYGVCDECCLGPSFGCEFVVYPYKAEQAKSNIIVLIGKVLNNEIGNNKARSMFIRLFKQRVKYIIKKCNKNKIHLL